METTWLIPQAKETRRSKTGEGLGGDGRGATYGRGRTGNGGEDERPQVGAGAPEVRRDGGGCRTAMGGDDGRGGDLGLASLWSRR